MVILLKLIILTVALICLSAVIAILHRNSVIELKGWTFKPFPLSESLTDPHKANKLDKAIDDDYKDYLKKNGLVLLESVSGYYEDQTGQHAIKFSAFQPGSFYGHNYVLIYDKENKRVKTIRWGSIDLRSITWKKEPSQSLQAIATASISWTLYQFRIPSFQPA